jgi:hypothetical protein
MTLGISGVTINLVFSSMGLRVEYYFGSSSADLNLMRFEALLESREGIEALVGEALEWDPMEGKKASRISLYGPKDGDVLRIDMWPTYLDWFSSAFEKMRRAGGGVFRAAVTRATNL